MQQPRHDQSRAIRSIGIAFFCLTVMIASLGCDTVAEITFKNEQLNDLTVLGFRNETCAPDPLVSCQPPGCGQLEFVMETSLGGFVVPNMQLDGLDGRVTPPPGDGANFGTEGTDFLFEKSWLFQQDAQGIDKLCSSSDDCATGFECHSFVETELPTKSIQISRAASVCAVPATITVETGSLRYTAFDSSDPQIGNSSTSALGFSGLSLALNMDNSGSLIGLTDNGINPESRTDPRSARLAAMKDFRSELLKEARSTLAGRSQFALFDLSGSGQDGATDVFLNDQLFKKSFLSDGEISAKLPGGRIVFDQALDDLENETQGLSPIWEGLQKSAVFFTQAQDRTVEKNYARASILFADSTSDGSTGIIGPNEVITAYQDDRVKGNVHIIHLDSLEVEDKTTRTGPLDDYYNVACETGGYYIYDAWPDALEGHLRRLGQAFEGKWSIQVTVNAQTSSGLLDMSLLDAGWYRVGGTLSVVLGDRTELFRFVAEETLSIGELEYEDSRILLRVSPQSGDSGQ